MNWIIGALEISWYFDDGLRVAKLKPIRLLLSDDGGGIVRLWALLNYCVMVFGGAVLYWLLRVVSTALFRSALMINSQ